MYARMFLISKLLHFKDFLSVCRSYYEYAFGDSRTDKNFLWIRYIHNKIQAIFSFDSFVTYTLQRIFMY